MTEVNNESIRQLRDAIIGTTPKSTQPTYARAIVTAAGSGGTWVRIEGADGVTPVSSSVAAVQPGDTVTVRIGNGECAITGNTTDAAVGQRVTQPIKQAAVEAVDVATAANESAAVAEAAAQTAHSAAQDAVQSAADAGRAAAVAQAAMGSTTVDWHDYTVQVGEDGQWHAFDKDGVEVPFSEISMVYQDALGLHVLGDGTRLDIGSSAVEVFDTNDSGESVARFGEGGARLGKENAPHTNVNPSGVSIVNASGISSFAALDGMAIVGDFYDNHLEVSTSGISIEKLEGFDSAEYSIQLRSESHTESSPSGIRRWADIFVQDNESVDIPHCSRFTASISRAITNGSRSLYAKNKLVIRDGGERVVLGSPKYDTYTSEGTIQVLMERLTWTYEPMATTDISVQGSDQDGRIAYVEGSTSNISRMKAVSSEPNTEPVFRADSDGNVTASGTVSAVGMSASGTVNAAAYNIGGIVPFAVTKVSFPAFTLAASNYTNQSITVSDTNAGHPGADYRCAGILGLYNSHYSDATLNSFYLTNIGVKNPIVHAAFRARTSTAVSFAAGECLAELLWIHKDAFKVVNN